MIRTRLTQKSEPAAHIRQCRWLE